MNSYEQKTTTIYEVTLIVKDKDGNVLESFTTMTSDNHRNFGDIGRQRTYNASIQDISKTFKGAGVDLLSPGLFGALISFNSMSYRWLMILYIFITMNCA